MPDISRYLVVVQQLVDEGKHPFILGSLPAPLESLVLGENDLASARAKVFTEDVGGPCVNP